MQIQEESPGVHFGELDEEVVKRFSEAVESGNLGNGTGLPDEMTEEEINKVIDMYS